MIISFFFKQYKCKQRKIKVSNDSSGKTEEVIVDGAAPADKEEAQLAQLLDEEAAEEEARSQLVENTRAREAQDTAIINSIRGRAVQEMAKKKVKISEAQNKEALQLFPRVSCLVAFIVGLLADVNKESSRLTTCWKGFF